MFKNLHEYYPTPEHLIEKMLFSLDFDRIKSILEPSAGDGKIVEVLKEKEKSLSSYYRKYSFDIDCIEINTDLQHILKGKGLKVVHNDFLTYDTMKEYDLIILNPPFSNGSKHLLKSLQIQERNGGAVICILNAETLKNECTNERKELNRKLKEHNASIDYMADAFLDAERKTGVEIALIKVQLPEVQRQSFIFDGLKRAQEAKELEYTEEDTYLAENDISKALTTQYKLELEAGIKLIKEYYAMSPLILSSFAKDEKTGEVIQSGKCILNLDLYANTDKYSNNLSVNDYIREVRSKYWKALFHNQKFIGNLTENLRCDFYNKIDELKEYDFSLYNIYQLRIEMQNKVVKGVEDTILSLFEELSNKYHYYNETSKNIHLYNGWKTNKSYIINKKVIIPLAGFRNLEYSWGRFNPTAYKVIEKLRDIEKCFNYLDGGLTNAIDLEESLKFAEEHGETKDIQLKYFTVTFYKKGTCHIVFTNLELLKKFNIFGSQHKGWLPPSYGKKKYKDMNSEEQAVVKDFEGEKAYNEIINKADYYLFDNSRLNLLEDQTA